jgi:hypothetical protein
MPRPESGYSPLTDCQKDILREWIVEGMPEKSEKKIMALAHCRQDVPKPPVVKLWLDAGHPETPP